MDPYFDSARYDRAVLSYQADIPFYRNLATEAGGTVLDLCCGTGRLTFPVSEEVTRVIGIDKSPAMLAAARARENPRIEWVRADCRNFSLGEKANLVFCGFNSLQEFLTDVSQRAVLERVRSHLGTEGKFAFDVVNPTPQFLNLYAASSLRSVKAWTKSWLGPLVPGGLGHQVGHYDRRRSIVKMDWFRFGSETRHVRLRWRWFVPLELDRLLRESGFRIEAKYGGFNGESFGAESPSQVFVCSLARGKS